MGKKKKKHKQYANPHALVKGRLTREEYKQYQEIGLPDPKQNWLELFTSTVIDDLFSVLHSCSDNQQKAEYIKNEFSYYGFYEVGEGTNVYTMANPAYPGVCFKFALDDYGIADNFNDVILEEAVNEMLDYPRYTHVLARHPSGIVSVQERKVVVADQDRMDSFRGSIMKTLHKLATEFLIADLSPNHYHLNYGIDRNGEWCFIDASDLYPLDNIRDKIRCNRAVGWDDKKKETKRCHGRLMYSPDFNTVVCTKCGAERLPLELRPKDKEDYGKMINGMMDGFSAEDRAAMEEQEMEAVLASQPAEKPKVIQKEPEPVEQPHEEEPQQEADEEVHEEPSGLPSKSNPGVIDFGATRQTKQHMPAFVSASSSDAEEEDDDDDDGIDRGHVSEPSDEAVRENSTGFQDPYADGDGESDDDEDDEEGTVVHAYDRSTGSVAEQEDPEPDVEDDPNRLFYEVVNTDDETPEKQPSITIHVRGNFDEAYLADGLPVYIMFEDTGLRALAITSQAMKKILDEIVADIME